MNDLATVHIPRPVAEPEAYEYLSVPVPRRRESLYRDVYTQLGWQVDAVKERSADTVTLRLGRVRLLSEGVVLDGLRNRAEQALRSVDALDRSVEAWGTRARRLTHGISAVYSVLGLLAAYLGLGTRVVVVLAVLSTAHLVLARLVASRARRLRTGRLDPQFAARLDDVEDAVRQARTVRASGPADGPHHLIGSRVQATVGAALR